MANNSGATIFGYEVADPFSSSLPAVELTPDCSRGLMSIEHEHCKSFYWIPNFVFQVTAAIESHSSRVPSRSGPRAPLLPLPHGHGDSSVRRWDIQTAGG